VYIAQRKAEKGEEKLGKEQIGCRTRFKEKQKGPRSGRVERKALSKKQKKGKGRKKKIFGSKRRKSKQEKEFLQKEKRVTLGLLVGSVV